MSSVLKYASILVVASFLTVIIFVGLGRLMVSHPAEFPNKASTEIANEMEDVIRPATIPTDKIYIPSKPEYSGDNFELPPAPDTKGRHPVDVEEPDFPAPERLSSPVVERIPDPDAPLINCVKPLCGMINDHAPRHGYLIDRFPPVFPVDAEKSGSCVFSLEVDGEGRPSAVRNLECTDSIFIETSKKSLMRWIFTPNFEDGDPVPFTIGPSKLTYQLMDKDGNTIPE